ncbi:hypothetical protein JW979_09360 [bacterium]|nr:hypothetical protein [candidate division CSSED10-310 bacterium]
MVKYLWAILLLVNVTVHGADLYVDYYYGNDDQSGESWNQAKKTIPVAILCATYGDVIHITAGLYKDPVILIPGISLLGAYPPGGGERNPDIFTTELDGLMQFQIMKSADDCLLDGLVFRNGYAPSGGALGISNSSIVVRNCRFINNVAYSEDPHGGGAVFIFSSAPLFEDCVFEGNGIIPANPKPGMYLVGGAIMSWTSSPVFINCIFDGNYVEDDNKTYLALGGASFCINSLPHFIECEFDNNSALYGGGVAWWNTSACHIARCRFSGNFAGEAGGAIASMARHQTIISNVSDSAFTENSALYGGAVAALQNTILEIDNCLMWDNAAGNKGGAIFSVHYSELTLTSSTLNANKLSGESVQGGANIYIGDQSIFHIVSNNITQGFNGEGFYLGDYTPLESCNFEYNCLYGNSRGNYGGTMPDQTGINGNIAADPEFAQNSLGDYFLSQTTAGQTKNSPCVNTGFQEFFKKCTTRTDWEPDVMPSDIGYHYNRRIALPFLNRYYYMKDMTLEFSVLNTGISPVSKETLYIALQIGADFFFLTPDLDATADPVAFSTDFDPIFDTIQPLFTIPLIVPDLPDIELIWHIAIMDNATGSLSDYCWTVCEMLSS